MSDSPFEGYLSSETMARQGCAAIRPRCQRLDNRRLHVTMHRTPAPTMARGYDDSLALLLKFDTGPLAALTIETRVSAVVIEVTTLPPLPLL